jgi:predicted amidohydrolase
LEEPDREAQFFWGHTMTRAHAMEAGAFVLSACGYMTPKDIPADFPLADTVSLDYAHGGSQVVAPLGIPLVPPTSGDTILYAECQADMIKVWKAIIDTVGHYARPDIVRLQFMKEAEVAEAARTALESRSSNHLERTAERHQLSRQQLETELERVAQKAG